MWGASKSTIKSAMGAAAGTVGFVLLLGYAHQLALGQAGFCMVGGYASAILCVQHKWDPLLALVVSHAGVGLGRTPA